MKKKIVKTISISMAAVLAAAGIGYCALNSDEKEAVADTGKDAQTIQDTIEKNVTFNEVGEDKEETVYVLTDANGNVNKTIVSDWLKNKDGSSTITDKSDLKNIENVKSDADYTTGKDGEITWTSNGEDIYYQGTTDKELPVDVKVTYILDGKEMSASEIAGKSGKVTIRFDYTNNTKKEVTVNGRKTEMYVPFTMISGMLLDGNTFRNVEVNSGKVISDGNRLVVVGLAFPGMNENLDIASFTDNKEMTFPETVEVTADVENFSLGLTLTMGSAELISSVNLNDVTAFDDLKEVVNKLVKSTNELQNGSTKLSTGLKTLKTSFGTYSTGVKTYVNTVNSNIGLLNDNMAPFANGINTALSGVNQMIAAMEGDEGAVSGAKKLADGSAQVNTGLNNLLAKIGTAGGTDNNTIAGAVNNIAAGSGTLFGYLDKMLAAFDNTSTSYGLTDGSQAVSDGVEQLSSELTTMVQTMNKTITDNQTKIDGLKAVIKGGISPTTGQALTEQEITTYTANINQLEGANAALQSVLAQMNPGTMQTQLGTLTTGADNLASGIKSLQQGIKDFKTNDKTLVDGASELNGKMSELESGVNELKNGSKQVSDGAASLSAGVDTLYTSMKNQLQPGLSTLFDGANLLTTSVNLLYEGTKPTSKDVGTLLSGTDQLTSGINDLSSGADTLSAGMKQFNDEAISKVSDFVDGDLTTIVERIKSTVNLANEYTIYSDAADGKSTSVKFIYETDGIEAK